MASSDNISINHALNVLKTIKTREESPEEKIKVSAILQECRKSTEGKTLKEAITILPPLTARDHESDEPTISCQTPPNYQGSEKESATRTGSDPTHDRPRRGRILSSPVPYDYVEPAPDGVDTKPDMGCTSHSGYMHNREGEIPVQSGSQLVKGDDSTRPLADSNRNLGDDLLIDSDQWAMPIRLKRRHENPKIEISQHDDEPDSSGDPDSDGREVTQTSKFSSVAPVSPGDFENVGLMKHLDTNKKGRRLHLPSERTSTPHPGTEDSTKKRGGHRREYDFIWTSDGVLVRSWCNPICAPVKQVPIREKCSCGTCPTVCEECISDE
uniref:Non-structural protein V n=1 Tax=Raton olivaceo morbillivirus TaxID=2928189 RepID=A0A9N7AAQ7_9MONO|nr:TPA_asm: V protein [Raton olivaceo morbillivirus]